MKARYMHSAHHHPSSFPTLRRCSCSVAFNSVSFHAPGSSSVSVEFAHFQSSSGLTLSAQNGPSSSDVPPEGCHTTTRPSISSLQDQSEKHSQVGNASASSLFRQRGYSDPTVACIRPVGVNESNPMERMCEILPNGPRV